MNTFTTSKNIDYKNNELYIQAVELIGYKTPKVGGSFVKYGQDKACDLDMSETMDYNDFDSYINKIILNKKKFNLVKMNFDEPYIKLNNIKNKLGYFDGNFKKIQNESIMDDVNELPNELKTNILLNINEYKENKSLNTLIKLKMFIENNLYPLWNFKDIKNRKIKYFEQIFDINKNNFDVFYIEIIYNNFRISNYIIFNKIQKNDSKMYWNLYDLVFNNEINYFKLLKKIMVFVKWLYFNKLIDDNNLHNQTIFIHNYIFDYINNIGNDYKIICNIKNELDIANIKLIKYQRKLKKHLDKKYQKYINHYQNIIDTNNNIYISKFNIINELSKNEYYNLTKWLVPYLTKYIIIQ
jgi:hypothetical protein